MTLTGGPAAADADDAGAPAADGGAAGRTHQHIADAGGDQDRCAAIETMTGFFMRPRL